MSPTKLQKNTPAIILLIIVCASMLVIIAAIAIGHRIHHNVLKKKGLLPTHNSYYVPRRTQSAGVSVDDPIRIDSAHRAMHLQVPKSILGKKQHLSKKGRDNGQAPEVSEQWPYQPKS
jgi:hypothetical protein